MGQAQACCECEGKDEEIFVGAKVQVKASVATPTYKWGYVTHESSGIVKSINGDEARIDFPERKAWLAKMYELQVIPEVEVYKDALQAEGLAAPVFEQAPPASQGKDKKKKTEEVAKASALSFSATFGEEVIGIQFGASLDPSDTDRLYISKLEGGADTTAGKYNLLVSKDPQLGELLASGQYIVEVNGVRGGAKQLYALLTRSTKVSAVFVKPTLYKCRINRNGRSLGLDLCYPNETGTSLLVKSILPDGAAQALEESARPKAGDRIISVNGATGDCQSLLDTIRQAPAMAELELGMSRCAES